MPNDSGDPFASKTLIDRAKLVYHTVRDYFVGLVEREKKEFEAAQQNLKRDSIPAPYADCPHCSAKESMRECAAGVTRCSACGWQPRIVGPPGISRAQLESFTYPDAEHRRKFQQGFGSAVARIVGRK